MSNRYEIREQIGKGGLGAVYKAFDTQLQREVAIKRVLTTDNATPEEVEASASKLIGEAQTLSSLNHPNIVTVFDVQQDEKGGFVVMELLKGETLDDTVERGVLTQEDFTEVVYQTMEALIAAQAVNVIHRDIKPTNIMVIWQASGKFQTKILDFGLAKFSKSPSVQTMDQDETVMGSIFFMAPEQFERGELDARTDLYQMGCVYYNALTGQYPFNGETAPQVMNAHLQHKVVPLDQIRPDLPPSICQWVMWMINRDIEHRPKSARDALKHWPRDPEPADASGPLEALPVEDTPQMSSSHVRIVTGATQAKAPPSLIVGTGTVGTLSGSQPIQPARSGGAGRMWIVLGGLAVAVAIFAGAILVKKAKAGSEVKRIAQVAAADNPMSSPSDVDLCIKYLGDPEADGEVKADARKELLRTLAAGADEKMIASLQSVESPPSLKAQLSEILAGRGHGAALPPMVEAFGKTSGESQVRILRAVGSLADAKSLNSLIDSFGLDLGQEARRELENTLLAVMRREEGISGMTDALLSKVSDAEGEGRRSLFRVLGTLGGEKVAARLGEIYGGGDDPELQRDAMQALVNWPDLSILPLAEKVVRETQDPALRIAAERAYVRLTGLPAAVTIEERVEMWKKAFGELSSPKEFGHLFENTMLFPGALTSAALAEWGKDDKYGSQAKKMKQTVDRLGAGALGVAPGDTVPGDRARLRGTREALLDRQRKSIAKWSSAETWFTWDLKFDEAGDYRIEVEQATLEDEPTDFVIYFGGKAFAGESRRSESLEKPVVVEMEGTVSLEADKVYTLALTAGMVVQPGMMDIFGIRFVKQ